MTDSSSAVVSLKQRRDVKHYTQLKGEEGQKIVYRAERFKRRDLFQRGTPKFFVNERDCVLQDLSMTGVSVLVRGMSVGGMGAINTFVPLVISHNNEVLLEAVGRIVREEKSPFGVIVSLSLSQTPIDVPALLDKYNDSIIRHELSHGNNHNVALVPAEYRVLIADVLHFFCRYKKILDGFLVSHTVDGVLDTTRELEMIKLCEEKAIPEWREICARGNAITQGLDKDSATHRAIKQYTEMLGCPETMPSAVFRRSYLKPLGYPGDYQVMEYIYQWGYEGDTPFEKFVHHITLDVGECIPNRMYMCKELIAKLVMQRGLSNDTTIFNVGAGSARELDILAAEGVLTENVVVTLVDQDIDALTLAQKNIKRSAAHRNIDLKVNTLNATFLQLTHFSDFAKNTPAQTIIYSMGLLDYFSAKQAKEFVANVYEKLEPQGSLLIANVRHSPTGMFWFLECFCDWTMIYRTEQDMIDLVEGLPQVSYTLTQDKTGGIYMMHITKGTL